MRLSSYTFWARWRSVVLELVLHNLAQHVFHFHSSGAHLLWNKARWRHSWRRVHLNKVYLVRSVGFLSQDVVNADDAVAVS